MLDQLEELSRHLAPVKAAAESIVQKVDRNDLSEAAFGTLLGPAQLLAKHVAEVETAARNLKRELGLFTR